MKTIDKLKQMKPSTFRDKISSYDIVNLYLEEFFNTTLQDEEVKEIYKKVDGFFTNESRNLFYETFSLTQEQYDWWSKTVKDILSNKLKLSKKRLDTEMSWIILDIGPLIKQQ